MKPLVSIVLTLYNIKKEYLNKCLDSLLNQTYSNIEIICIDDCSHEVNYNYILSLSDKIKLYKNEQNLGMNKTVAKGFELATGKYITRVGPDDYVDLTFIEKEVNILENNPDVGAVCCNIRRFEDANYAIIRPQHWDLKRILNGELDGTGYDGGMMFRSTLLSKIAINLYYKVCIDFDFQLQLLENMPIVTLNEILYFYRTNKYCISRTVTMQQRKFIMNTILNTHRKKLNNEKPKVLIYEGFSWHGECIPSYYQYFKELGYDIDIVFCYKASETPLWMLKDVHVIQIQNMVSDNTVAFNNHIKELKTKVPNLFNYDLYFICTMNVVSYKFVDFLYKHDHTFRNKIVHQNHINYDFYRKWIPSRLFDDNGLTLGLNNEKFSQLAPIKNLENKEHNKIETDFSQHKIITLFVSGLTPLHFKNFEELVRAVDKLNDDGYTFRINITGIKQQGKFILPQSENVKYLGWLDFKELADQYTNNDFLFVLFDECPLSKNNEYKDFLQGRVSGSRNMSIIYKIPLVVQEPFQQAWGLNDSNSISYHGHDYEQILLQLSQIKKDHYNNIVKNLKLKEQEEFRLGLDNLKHKINIVNNLPIIPNTKDKNNHQRVIIKPINNSTRVKKPRFGAKKY